MVLICNICDKGIIKSFGKTKFGFLPIKESEKWDILIIAVYASMHIQKIANMVVKNVIRKEQG